MSRIVELGLVEVVNNLRQQFPVNRIAKIVNEKYLPEGEEPISAMAFHRYFKSHAPISLSDTTGGITTNEEVDPYDEMKSLSETMDNRIETLSEQIRLIEQSAKANNDIPENKKIELAKDSAYCAAVKLLELLVSRKQSLLNDIARYQAELGTYANIREILKIMIGTLKQYNGAYESFKQMISANKDLKALCK